MRNLWYGIGVAIAFHHAVYKIEYIWGKRCCCEEPVFNSEERESRSVEGDDREEEAVKEKVKGI